MPKNSLPGSLIIGVDEAGRGALAGPVAVGVVLTARDFSWQQLLPEVDDSKRLTLAKRAEIFSVAKTLKATGVLDFRVALTGARLIDQVGINPAVKLALGRALSRLRLGGRLGERSVIDLYSASVKLDGGLFAPANYQNQQTIIKGDQTEPIIGLASILAKVWRDRYMVRLSAVKDYLPYGLATHKGYGTAFHRKAIRQNGLSPEHRHSYCTKITLSHC